MQHRRLTGQVKWRRLLAARGAQQGHNDVNSVHGPRERAGGGARSSKAQDRVCSTPVYLGHATLSSFQTWDFLRELPNKRPHRLIQQRIIENITMIS